MTRNGKTWLAQFNEFRPEDMVVLGPYKIDPASITESQMMLDKVPTSFMADMVKFDKLVNYNGETPVVTPLVLSGDVDYATHGFPPATEKEYINLGYRILRAPNYNGPALVPQPPWRPSTRRKCARRWPTPSTATRTALSRWVTPARPRQHGGLLRQLGRQLADRGCHCQAQ
jgi:hypothetical protein